MKNFLKKQFIVVLLVMCGVLGLGIFGNQNLALERIIDVDLLSNQQQGMNYLNSLDDSHLSISGEKINYVGYKNVDDLYSADYLSETNSDISDYKMSFDVLYILALDLLYLDISLIDADNNVVDKVTLNGYAIEYDNGKRDIQFDYYGYTFYSSEVISDGNVDKLSLTAIFELMMTDDGGGGTIYPIVSVSNSIVGLDSAIENAKDYLNPPDVWYDGPMKYLMWKIKLELARKDFEHNSSLSTVVGGTDGYINDQNDSKWDSWDYGLSTLGGAGCGIFGMYNFLRSTNSTLDLPSLIALVQLLNADVAFGAFGTNVYPSDMSFSETSIFDSIIQNVIIPIATDIIPGLTQSLIDAEFADKDDWWYTWFGWTYDAQLLITTASLEVAFLGLFATSDFFVEWYWSSVRSVTEVLSLYGIDDISNTSNLDTFVTNSSASQYFILSYWHGSVPTTNTIDVLGGAHTVFVRRVGDIYRVYNLNGYGSTSDFSNLYLIIDSTLSAARLKILSGMVIN
jgi:hypothetical protein